MSISFECCGEICQIPHFIFQTISQFFFKLCITLRCHKRWLHCTFLNVMYFAWKVPIKVLIFEAWECLIKIYQIFVIFEQQIGFYSKFASLFSVMRHKSYVVFELKFYMLSVKLLLSKSYNVSAKKVQKSYHSRHWRVI